MPISAETYERVALEDGDHSWELVCGRLRRKPDMTTEHGFSARMLAALLSRQLDLTAYSVGTDSGRVRRSNGSFFVPDLCVIPMAYVRRLHEHPGTFEVYDDPLPLIVEVWSPSTGDYDVDEKLAEYRLRGDLEIWRIHPYERTLIAWRRRPDGGYDEVVIREGSVRPVSLPDVEIDLGALFLD
jgi:Uma2 family endonuclease